MKHTKNRHYVAKLLWLAWLVASIGWIAFAIVEQEQELRSWVDYHLDYERTAASHKTQQLQAKAYREQLLAQIDAAATQAEAEVRRKPGTLAKVDSQLMEYEISKAVEKAKASKKYELTHKTGNVYVDLQNEEALTRDVRVEELPPRPSGNWLIVLFVPPITLALVGTLAPRLFLAAFSTSGGRALVGVSVLWLLTALAWGFVFEWKNYFNIQKYLGLILLPPILVTVAASLWRWARKSRS